MRNLIAAASLLTLASCVAPSTPEPQPAPAPTKAPPPAPAPVPPTSSDWRDWPLTPGDWSYASDARGSTARYGRSGAPVLTLRCDRAARQVTFAIPERAGASETATVRTSSTARALGLRSDGAGHQSLPLTANDPLLDAMGFSRGRFVIEQRGGATLVVPAWAEILRVAEDCRG